MERVRAKIIQDSFRKRRQFVMHKEYELAELHRMEVYSIVDCSVPEL
jgi:hypothetical protein